MRKRERENPCGVCGHYHKYELGEVCGVCGHRMPVVVQQPPSAFPSEIVPEFLFLGSYDNASRGELLKTLGISHILNTVPACQNLYRNSFTYHCVPNDRSIQFDDAIQFLEKCEREKARVLVHCMSGKSRSPAIVIAYLMKSRGWRLQQSHQWVKERRPQVDLSTDVYQQLLELEHKIFRSNESTSVQLAAPSDSAPTFGFGQRTNSSPPIPVFNQHSSPSLFEHTAEQNLPCNFVFGASRSPEQKCTDNNSFGVIPPGAGEAPMDSS